MPLIPLATIGEAAAGVFGATAALLLVGGGVMLRSQLQRHRYELAKLALDKGLPPPLMAAPPGWLASLRQAVVILAIGLGLIGAGCGAMALGHNVPEPSAAELAADAPPDPALPALLRHPPHPSPAIERWHFAQDEMAVGLAAAGSGAILVLLGVVRIAFAVVERRYEPPTPASPTHPDLTKGA